MSGWSVKGDIVQSINAWISVTFSLTGITFVHCSYLSLLDSTKFEQTRPSTRSTATQSVEMLHL